jgi:SH3 domain protein
MRPASTLALLLILSVLSALAAAAHITDKLVVGLYPEPSLQGEPSRLLTSGTPVEVLKRAKGAVQVRLADDTRGWLEARYVTEEKPAAMMLLEAQAEIRRLKARLKASGASSQDAPARHLPSVEDARAQQRLAEAQKRIQTLEAATRELPALRAAAQERDELKSRIDELRRLLGVKVTAQAGPGRADGQTAPWWRAHLPWLIGGLLAVVGFAAGVGFVDWRIRKRYGGFRL